jgi:uncharacterized protein CbrC (UPF0167 family)
MHWFCKPSPTFRTHHLHVVPFRSQLWVDRLAFRDFLRSHRSVAMEYATLKHALAERYEFDRDAYTDAKSQFVETVLRLAAEASQSGAGKLGRGSPSGRPPVSSSGGVATGESMSTPQLNAKPSGGTDERAMSDSLPSFRYHPNPLATGSINPSTVACVCCGRARGYVYVGPVYAEEELEEKLCPWCIADGSAHARFDADFVDVDAIGDRGTWEKVERSIAEEVAFRTPGFSAWQQERWFTCCGDAALFLGPAGHSEVIAHGPTAVEALRTELGWDDGPEWKNYLASLTKDGQPTAYLFRCRHCGKIGGYSDFT